MPRFRTVDDYIAAAPAAGHEHLERLRRILRDVAPDADEVIKWNAPFYIEPRYLFSFAAFKAHMAFAPSAETLEAFAKELEGNTTTREYLKIAYHEPLPEDLIRRMAKRRLETVAARDDTSFW